MTSHSTSKAQGFHPSHNGLTDQRWTTVANRMTRDFNRAMFLCVIMTCIAGAQSTHQRAVNGSDYLYVWAGDVKKEMSDVLFIMDARVDSPTYAHIVATFPVGVSGTMPHHTEYEFPESRLLFANGWNTGRTFLLDLKNPINPRLAGTFTTKSGYSYPHSFARLPNGHVLATFQSGGKGYTPPGGLVELDEQAHALRAVSAEDPDNDRYFIWPYSLVVLPKIDRVVSTNFPMAFDQDMWPAGGLPYFGENDVVTRDIQIWSLNDLRLIATLPLPVAPNGWSQEEPAEPRELPDGTVYVNTFRCGLYRVVNLDSEKPKAEFVYSLPGGDSLQTRCGVPVVVGHYWIQTVAGLPGLIALDILNTAKPTEASRLEFDQRFKNAHWIAADRKGSRLVVTGAGESWLLVVDLDPTTGKLTLDETFRNSVANENHPSGQEQLPNASGVNFDRAVWPDGVRGKAVVHGALFGPK
jgi:hypothetical protein